MMTDDFAGNDTPMYDAETGNMTSSVGMTPSLNGIATPASCYRMTPSGAGILTSN